MIDSSTIDLERALVGAILSRPERLEEAGALRRQDFASIDWGRCWAALTARHEAGQDIDPFLIHDDLTATGHGDVIGLTDLSGAMLNCGTAIESYAQKIRTASLTRRTLLAANSVNELWERGARGQELLDGVSKLLSEVDSQTGVDRSVHISELARDRFLQLSEIAERVANGEPAGTGLLTGIESLDNVLGGLQPGMVSIVAGRPAMGKSAFALSLCRNISARGEGVHVFSLEDTRESYLDRVFADYVGLSTQQIRSCRGITRAHMALFVKAFESLKSSKWIVDDSSALDADDIVRSVRRNMSRNNTKIAVIDYAQLLKRRPRESTREMISRSMQTFLAAARRDGTCYLVLSQLNRECEKREDKRPMLSDLKESGALEENSKCVMMLFRPGYYDSQVPETELEIKLAKNSNGLTGIVKATFDGARMVVR